MIKFIVFIYTVLSNAQEESTREGCTEVKDTETQSIKSVLKSQKSKFPAKVYV
ncbi:hypothetical protein NIES2107_01940 [Nostoc carneum NIES-2107]|nr:hypothetical protein NIES2107_01940 [Nostoc carneum NIES-2107]